MSEFDILTEIVNEVTGIDKNTLISRNKIRKVSELRMMCTNIMHEYRPELKLRVLAGFMGLSHSSIVHHNKTHMDLLLQPDGKYKELFNKIRLDYKRRMIKYDVSYKKNLIDKRKRLQTMLDEINQILE